MILINGEEQSSRSQDIYVTCWDPWWRVIYMLQHPCRCLHSILVQKRDIHCERMLWSRCPAVRVNTILNEVWVGTHLTFWSYVPPQPSFFQPSAKFLHAHSPIFEGYFCRDCGHLSNLHMNSWPVFLRLAPSRMRNWLWMAYLLFLAGMVCEEGISS